MKKTDFIWLLFGWMAIGILYGFTSYGYAIAILPIVIAFGLITLKSIDDAFSMRKYLFITSPFYAVLVGFIIRFAVIRGSVDVIVVKVSCLLILVASVIVFLLPFIFRFKSKQEM